MTGLPLLDVIAGKRPRLRSLPRLPAPKELALHFSTKRHLDRFAAPGWFWWHADSGERDDPEVRAKLRRMGARRGLPDFMLLSPRTPDRAGGLLHALELKRRGAALDEAQAEFAAWCAAHGVPHAVADTFDGVLASFRAWRCCTIDFADGRFVEAAP